MNTREAPGVPPLLLAVLTAVLLFLAAPGAFSIGLLAWVALVPLLWACRQTTPRQGARLGLLTGLLFYSLLLYWIVIVLSTYGHLPWWLSAPALVLLALYMSLYLALFAAGISWLRQRRISVLWSAPLLWVALDFIRAHLFSGFPWQDLAYSQYKLPLLFQTADLFGHHGVTFLIVLTNGLVTALLSLIREQSRSERRLALLAAGLLLLGSLVYSGLRYQQLGRDLAQAPVRPVTVVQGNIPQDQKWTAAFRTRTVESYLQLSWQALAQQPTDLLIWPETALPFYPLESRLFPEVRQHLLEPARVGLLTGAPHREPVGDLLHYYNSAILISDQGVIEGRYDKQHLVPFGEYIPLRRFLPFSGPLVETIGDFTPGSSLGPLSCKDLRIGVLICFESIFPELARRQTAQGANLLVNLTNDAWFGKSSAPRQHLSMAVFRAVENRRSLARAANTGISGFVSPRGQLIERTELFQPAFLTEQVPLLTTTPFYVRYGHFFALTCLLLLAPLALAALRRPLHS